LCIARGDQITAILVMYAMFVLVGVGGLMAQAQLGPMAKDFKIDNIPVTILGLTLRRSHLHLRSTVR